MAIISAAAERFCSGRFVVMFSTPEICEKDGRRAGSPDSFFTYFGGGQGAKRLWTPQVRKAKPFELEGDEQIIIKKPPIKGRMPGVKHLA